MTTERSGGRQWFSERLFVESVSEHGRGAYCASIVCHCIAAIGVVIVVVTQPVAVVRVGDGRPMAFPAVFAVEPVSFPGPGPTPVESSAPRKAPRPITGDPGPAHPADAPAPIEAPATIEPDTSPQFGGDGIAGGLDGVAGSVGGGGVPGGSGRAGPLRVGGGVRPPQKIKDVRPVYPDGALQGDAAGTVVIEATIGVDGRVTDLQIVHSVAALDRAAIEAVRQWVYSPSVVDGRPVVVVMTVIVNFAIQ